MIEGSETFTPAGGPVLYRTLYRTKRGAAQPAPARIHGGKIEDVTEEGAVRLRVVAMQEDMGTGDSRGQGAEFIKEDWHSQIFAPPESRKWLSPRGLCAVQNLLTGGRGFSYLFRDEFSFPSPPSPSCAQHVGGGVLR